MFLRSFVGHEITSFCKFSYSILYSLFPFLASGISIIKLYLLSKLVREFPLLSDVFLLLLDKWLATNDRLSDFPKKKKLSLKQHADLVFSSLVVTDVENFRLILDSFIIKRSTARFPWRRTGFKPGIERFPRKTRTNPKEWNKNKNTVVMTS